MKNENSGKDNKVHTKKTNREMLANMSNEELASYLFGISGVCEMCDNSCYNYNCRRYICINLNGDCTEHIQKWLESEVE